jgi:signal transduction histidine kinase
MSVPVKSKADAQDFDVKTNPRPLRHFGDTCPTSICHNAVMRLPLPTKATLKPRHSWASSLQRSRLQIRVAFVVIIFFLIAQVVWWVVFQRGYINRTVEQTTMSWQREARMANLALENAAPQSRAGLLAALRLEGDHLNLETTPITVNLAALEAYSHRQERYVRMFAFELPFFLIVMLSGLYVIWLSIRSDTELKRRQQNFLMAATHEFRTPISTLTLLVETALYRELPRQKQLEVLNRMNTEVGRLQDVSERVLATARLEQGLGVNALEVQDLNRVVNRILEAQREKLEARGARLRLEMHNAPLPVKLDEAAFAIVLSNLLENAVNYTPDPVKPVTLKLEARGSLADLSVTDCGVGLEPHEVAHVFDQFYRVGNELTRTAKGLGLGLYLVRGISELLGGRVRCEPLEQGTRFTVTLPLAQLANESGLETSMPRHA